MSPNPQEIVDLVTFIEEFLNRKPNFLCSASKSLSVSTHFSGLEFNSHSEHFFCIISFKNQFLYKSQFNCEPNIYVDKAFSFDLVHVILILPPLYCCLCSLSHPAFTYSKLTIETLEQGVNMFKVNNKDSGIFIVNFEHISHLVQVFLLLTLSR